MYKYVGMKKTGLYVNSSVEGEAIESKIERYVNNKEPLGDGAPLIFTERKDGVQPSYNIRTDRFDVAIDGMDAVTASYQARREERHNNPDKPDATIGGAEPTQGTGE